MSDTFVFWSLVAVVCGGFAAAEYMYVCEAVNICRDRLRSPWYKVLVVSVAVFDCLAFHGCMKEGFGEYIRWLYVWGPSPNATIAIGLALSPLIGFVFLWFFEAVFVAGFVVSAFGMGHSTVLPTVTLACVALFVCLAVLAFSAQVVRVAVMYKVPRRSWLKLIFVFYVTYWPSAFLIDTFASR